MTAHDELVAAYADYRDAYADYRVAYADYRDAYADYRDEQATTPHTVTTVEEYAALPDGSIVAESGGGAFTRIGGKWCDTPGYGSYTHARMDGTTRELLREGWGE